jgi:hypothetical protein
MMATKDELVAIRKQFESNPTSLGKDPKFAERVLVAGMMEDTDLSISALSNLVRDPAYLQNLKMAWDAFLKAAKLP